MLSKNVFLYGSTSKENFELVKKHRNRFNYKVWRIVSGVASLYFWVMFFSAFSIGVVKPNAIADLVSAVFTAVVFVLFMTVVKADSKWLMPLIYATAFVLLAFGIVIGAVLSPDYLAVTYHVLLIALPLIVVDKPYKMGILEFVMSVVFTVFCICLKSGGTAELDIYNVVFFSVLGQFVNYYMAGRNISQLVTIRRIEIASYVDDMTKIFNRKAYERDIRKMEELDDKFVYIIFDVNGLKVANDKYGHSAGDEVLIGAANCINQCFKPYGKVYRTGGDEFVALIHADEEQLVRAVEEYRAAVSNWQGELVKKLFISMGYAGRAEFPELSLLELAQTADERMYQEKTAYYELVGETR
ncbi:MAG: GGDEF domain-containing protein [Clostridia bacterium]|nr:GGDEF domain-containing protein [Clostridia bacterium]